ncbi:hypothetical protein SAMN06265365_10643 [Tistlia consotensis]|uniref:Uncharacterized protein n=1 Tax=Tistlia consotensis USBA 355 TaxID=560819 RepID=A0A1Y6BGI9_9PROT|nr:hypothetical protein [Tistlia consotensis]SMF02907.1 hypothetical protein SAMN05428998_10394 [Tistlia consotensis USBA 355]SNR53212.1 hypothetical protein SAMN06265365_10643 [Tistlia consotensis]
MTESDAGDSAPGRVESEILAYLRMRPSAVDTARGVREWWLARLQPRPVAGEVESALERLARAGLVRCRTNPDGTVLWFAAPPGAGEA